MWLGWCTHINKTNDKAAGEKTVTNEKRVTFEYCGPFNDCLSGISNTEVENGKDINVVMSMWIALKYSDHY